MYDTAIIGTGPAGLSAAINLKLHNKDFVWFGSEEMSAKVEKSEKIANYPGFGLISGKELNEKLMSHAKEMEIEITDKKVTNILKNGDHYTLLADNDMYEARTILMATGAATAKGIDGETEFLGRGVSYCATCDGFLYKGKTIAAICGSKRYEHEVEYLAELAEKVYVFAPYKGAEFRASNIEVTSGPITSVSGGMKVTEITLRDETKIPVDGLFCLRDAVSLYVLLPGLETDGPHIVVDRLCKTNLEGCFAAGDCTGRPYQITKSVGEGNVAAHSILEYLSA